MPHKFKIGAIVYYRPKGRMLNTARGTYTVIGRMPAGSDVTHVLGTTCHLCVRAGHGGERPET
jgi:hypothetical protein